MRIVGVVHASRDDPSPRVAACDRGLLAVLLAEYEDLGSAMATQCTAVRGLLLRGMTPIGDLLAADCPTTRS
jgi:hypothetical protein